MTVINVPADMSVKKVKELHQGLKDAVGREDDLTLDFSEAGRVDLAVMQVLLAASRACRKRKKALKIKSASEELKNQMRICGMIK